MMRADNLLPFGWEHTYRWALQKYDLVPFFYPTRWLEIPDEPGFQVEDTIEVGGDFWLWDVGLAGLGRIQSDQENWPAAMIPNVEMLLEIDGQYVTGNFMPWPYYLGLTSRRGFGPGWILRKGALITVHLRSILPWDTDVILAEHVQMVAIGAQLAKLGAATYSEDFYYRNITLEDWDKITFLRPFSYTGKELYDPTTPNIPTQVPVRIRNRPFLVRNISVFSENPEGNAIQDGPWAPGRNPPNVIISDDGGFWHGVDQSPGIAPMAAFQDGALNPVDFRIPRFVPALREITAYLDGYMYAPSDITTPWKVGIIYNGYEIMNDRRTEVEPPPSASAASDYRQREGAR